MQKIKTCSKNHDQVDYLVAKCPCCNMLEIMHQREDEMVEYLDRMFDDEEADLRSFNRRLKRVESAVGLRRVLWPFRKTIAAQFPSLEPEDREIPREMSQEVNWSAD